MIKLRDEKLIDKIMEWLNMDGLIDNTLHDQTMARNIIQRHLTHPTDEGIEPLNENIIQLYDSVRFWTAWDNVDEFIRHVYMKLGNHFTNVEGIEKEEPTVPDIILLWKDDISDDDMGCEIYWWVSDGKAIITGVIYKPKEVKPPTKDTIEKIEQPKVWDSVWVNVDERYTVPWVIKKILYTVEWKGRWEMYVWEDKIEIDNSRQ